MDGSYSVSLCVFFQKGTYIYIYHSIPFTHLIQLGPNHGVERVDEVVFADERGGEPQFGVRGDDVEDALEGAVCGVFGVWGVVGV